jgi:hypothetical protein
MINITLQFPTNDTHGNPITEEDVKQWGVAAKKSTEGFTGISIKLISVTRVTGNGRNANNTQ